MKKDKNIVGKFILAITICFSVMEIGIVVSFYMFTKMNII